MEKEKISAKNYRELIVWQDAIKIAKAVYLLTGKFPKQETYALADQLRRAAVSVPSNIAEGQARKSPGDFRRFLHIALGSLAEVDTQLILAQEFGYLSKEDIDPMDMEIQNLRKKLYALINSLPSATNR
ncbi:MAG TPA: four helix bundle protein [Anaerolineales bacterium]|nr:four helix bundle protein [Anaerolineales bacterium]HNC88960.1 four helix bundle protein [Anaerolineales bacterium]HND93299.1 four helix bundle protein [Anaerolineales bacterium]HNE68371.1 four helix bundle protein [Anaerolineales bacterium]